MSNVNVAVVRRWFEEVWNQRRAEAITELLGDESVCHGDEGPIRGAEEFTQRLYNPFVAAFPDLRINLDGEVEQGDQVVVRWTAVGTHSGDGLGFPPTGQPVTFQGITWVQVRDGKLHLGWQHTNIPEVIRQLEQGAHSLSGSNQDATS